MQGRTWKNRPVGQVATVVALGLWLSSAWCARSQLAITEVMSHASTNHGATYVPWGSDFWELTNFGTNSLSLSNYTFADSLESPRFPLDLSNQLRIAPGESIIFFRTKPTETPTEALFREWWGSCLSTQVQVRPYGWQPGFDERMDGVRLYDGEGRLVDRVDFGIARRGVTFISDTNTGEFGVLSVLGVCGTCQAATADDIGSPGVAWGPVALRIVEDPTNVTVCSGLDASFSVWATGLPRPRFQWFSNGVAIPGAVASSLTVTNPDPDVLVLYQVEVYNGLERLTSGVVQAHVSKVPSPPQMVKPPADMTLVPGQRARFSVAACAWPPAHYQWLSNEVAIPGATNRSLSVPNCALAMSGTRYCVQITNALGTSRACAQLTVTPKPSLEITEIMGFASPDCPEHQDWFELTNVGTNSANLLGFRFSDRAVLDTAHTVTEPVVLAPGESVIFVEAMTREAFFRWWGADRLPPRLQVITYLGLGISEVGGDELYIWNAGAENPEDEDGTVDGRSFLDFLPGVSKRFDTNDCLAGCDTEEGVLGAFRAEPCSAQSTAELGTPGFGTLRPCFVGIQPGPGGVTLRWHAIQGQTYRLFYTTNLADPVWTLLPTGLPASAGSFQETRDTTLGTNQQRYYRLEEGP
jgi:hypothetical protein